MHEIAGAWLMTSLTQSPLMIALMQTAAYVPILVIGIPAGAVADLNDRRHIVLWGQSWMLVAAASLGMLTISGLVTPWLLLLFTLLMGMGAASTVPAFGVLTQELVKPEQLQAALAINSSGRHIARGIGSALGGFTIALAGVGTVFLINAASFAGILLVLSLWCAQSPAKSRQGGAIWPAIQDGFAYTLDSKSLRTINAITFLFGLSASALWALLPLLLRQDLNMTSFEYGVAMSAFGLGSLVGVSGLAWLRRIFSISGATAAGVMLMAFALICVAASRNAWHAFAAMGLAGIAWIVVVSALNTYVQQNSEDSIRSRTTAIFATIWQAGLAIGSFLWGILASMTSTRTTLFASALALALTALVFASHKLPDQTKPHAGKRD
jgi:predicted MFS family arabinose efflux permease